MPIELRQSAILKWGDLNGGSRVNTLTTQANPAAVLGPVATLAGAMQAASSAGLWYAAMQPVVNYNNTPVTGPYPTCQDSLQLIFRSSAGNTCRLNVPAPVAALFLPGAQRVDFANPLVDAIVQAAFGCLADPYGNPFVVAVSGLRMKVEIPQVAGG